MGLAYDGLVWVPEDSRRIKSMWPLTSPFPRCSLLASLNLREPLSFTPNSSNCLLKYLVS